MSKLNGGVAELGTAMVAWIVGWVALAAGVVVEFELPPHDASKTDPLSANADKSCLFIDCLRNASASSLRNGGPFIDREHEAPP
jgi:hypothetical protein